MSSCFHIMGWVRGDERCARNTGGGTEDRGSGQAPTSGKAEQWPWLSRIDRGEQKFP